LDWLFTNCRNKCLLHDSPVLIYGKLCPSPTRTLPVGALTGLGNCPKRRVPGHVAPSPTVGDVTDTGGCREPATSSLNKDRDKDGCSIDRVTPLDPRVF